MMSSATRVSVVSGREGAHLYHSNSRNWDKSKVMRTRHKAFIHLGRKNQGVLKTHESR